MRNTFCKTRKEVLDEELQFTIHRGIDDDSDGEDKGDDPA
jgi:hypothetical protein